MLVYILDKGSGAPLVPGYKFWHSGTNLLDKYRPVEQKQMHWTSGTDFWIHSAPPRLHSISLREDGIASESDFVASFRVDINARTITLRQHWRLHPRLSPNTSVKFTNNGKNWIVTGGFWTNNLNEFLFAWIDTDKEELTNLRNF